MDTNVFVALFSGDEQTSSTSQAALEEARAGWLLGSYPPVYAELVASIIKEIMRSTFSCPVRALGDLLAAVSRHRESERCYTDAVAAFDKALSRAPDAIYVHVHKGTTLIALGDLLAAQSRYQEAEGAFSDAAEALDEVLSRIPDDADLHILKALTLVNQGELVRILGAQGHVVRALLDEAQSHAEHILSLVPRDEDAVSLLAQIRDLLDDLDDSSQR